VPQAITATQVLKNLDREGKLLRPDEARQKGRSKEYTDIKVAVIA
jgi:hypothetical protein